METLVPTVTLPASLSVNEADAALAVYRAETMVVVRLGDGEHSSWHAFSAGDLIRRLIGADGTETLDRVLGLDPAAGLTRVSSDDIRARRSSFRGVVTSGRDAVGLTFDPREEEPAPPPRTRSWQPPPPPMAPAPDVGAPPARTTADRRTRSAGTPPPTAPPPSPDTAPAASPELPGPPTGTALHPRLETPDRVAPSASFEATVGVASTSQAGLSGGPMTVATADAEFELEVQLGGDGFDFPEGTRRTLVVHRDRIDEASVTLPVVAPDRETPGRIEVSYVHGGVPIGRAWREIRVGGAPPQPEGRPESGSLPIDMSGGIAPDLTVTVTEGMAPGRYLWTFSSPHDVELPDHQVVGPVVADPRSFALGHVKELARTDGSDLARQTVTGISRMVSRAAPNEFWTVLDRVWRATRAAGEDVPSVLMISDDRFIPWELASTETDWIDPALVATGAPQMLGAQVALGRWLPAGPSTPRGVPRPAVPPTDRVAIDRFALVIGDYLAEMGQRPLPMAKEEGERLAATYPHVRMGATAEEMRTLLADELRQDGAPVDVQVIHFACHGEVDPNNPAYNGIVLSDTALRLDHMTVAGSLVGRNDQPLVFLNACQLAHDTGDLLGDYGGLAGAFLIEGCRGFVAALWSVNDVAARDIALDFYRMTIGEGLTAGEALRRIRGRGFDGETITPFAYVYYGHPDLRLSLGSDGVVVDLRSEDHADAGRN